MNLLAFGALGSFQTSQPTWMDIHHPQLLGTQIQPQTQNIDAIVKPHK